MTVALNGELSKMNRTVSGIRQSFNATTHKPMATEQAQEAQTTNPIPSERQFLDDLKIMLSKELDSAKTNEALQFATELYHHNSSNEKEVSSFVLLRHFSNLLIQRLPFFMQFSYGISIIQNALGLTEGEICNIISKDPNDCTEEDF